jgi:hypothetical protein
VSRLLRTTAALTRAPQLRCDDAADNAAHEAVMRNAAFAFVEGWAYRCPALVRTHRSFYRHIFYEERPPVASMTILKAGVTHIAVHIRRGDFATWEDGKYCYPDSVYFAAIDQVIRLARGGHQILIFSDDRTLDRSAFSRQFGDVFVSSLDAHSDHYLMSLCDYIIGPPSTFSMWASYIGETKFCPIETPGQTISESSFAIC